MASGLTKVSSTVIESVACLDHWKYPSFSYLRECTFNFNFTLSCSVKVQMQRRPLWNGPDPGRECWHLSARGRPGNVEKGKHTDKSQQKLRTSDPPCARLYMSLLLPARIYEFFSMRRKGKWRSLTYSSHVQKNSKFSLILASTLNLEGQPMETSYNWVR